MRRLIETFYEEISQQMTRKNNNPTQFRRPILHSLDYKFRDFQGEIADKPNQSVS